MNKEQSLNKTIAQIWEDKYVVPLYQRNFAWGEEQIGQLIQDIYTKWIININILLIIKYFMIWK